MSAQPRSDLVAFFVNRFGDSLNQETPLFSSFSSLFFAPTLLRAGVSVVLGLMWLWSLRLHIGEKKRSLLRFCLLAFKNTHSIDSQISNLSRTKVTAKLQHHVTGKLYGLSGWTMSTDSDSSVRSLKLSFWFSSLPVDLHIPLFHHVSVTNNDNFYFMNHRWFLKDRIIPY